VYSVMKAGGGQVSLGRRLMDVGSVIKGRARILLTNKSSLVTYGIFFLM